MYNQWDQRCLSRRVIALDRNDTFCLEALVYRRDLRCVWNEAHVWKRLCFVFQREFILSPIDRLSKIEQLVVQIADLKLVVAHIASVEVFEAANFKQGPVRALSA